MQLDFHIEFFRTLAEKGGPDPEEYDHLTESYHVLSSAIRKGVISSTELHNIWRYIGQAFSVDTIQGFVANKPHGYAGDFEVIDRIYTFWTSPRKCLEKWDIYFHTLQAPQAVRRRKTYFIDFVNRRDRERELHVLNVGCGPARDVFEYLNTYGENCTYFHCIDNDPRAISYARSLCKGSQQIFFIEKNVFRFRTQKRFSIVWSAGLFDYLNDKAFVFLLRRLFHITEPGGEIVIGNFSPDNTTRAQMEVGEWYLNYRTTDNLIALAGKAGLPMEDVFVEKIYDGILLFLHARKKMNAA